MADYNSLKSAGLTKPSGNVSLGSNTSRYTDIFLSGNVNIGSTSLTSTNAVAPRVTVISYPGNDTAANPVGGQTIILNGSGFQSGATVLVSGTIVDVVSFVSSIQLTFVSPAMTAGSYVLYVINPDGGTATSIPGVQYSGVPTWTTTAGSLGSSDESVAVTYTVAATGDAPVTYSVFSGSLPSGLSLNSSTGVITGTAPAVESDTTYNFTIRATDAQNQDTDRAFSLTIEAVIYTLTPAANNINEGSALTINVSGSNITDGTYYYTVNTNAGDFATSSGSFTITSNSGSFTVTPTADLTTEGAETFTVSIRSGSTSGTVLATTSSITINDTSTTPAAVGQAEYTSVGTYTWTAPAGVTAVSVVAVGGGGGATGGAGGGGLGWKNNISVTPGTGYTVVVGKGGDAFVGKGNGGTSYFISTGTVAGYGGGGAPAHQYGYEVDGVGGSYVGDGGGNGGNGGAHPGGSYNANPYGGSGGAGGYSGNGGLGATAGSNTGSAGNGGGGGGGGSNSMSFAGNGGGVGIYGQGASGGGGPAGGSGATGSGGGGSGGQSTYGRYGGGGALSSNPGSTTDNYGAVRIIWGTGRAFPSTLTTNQ